MPDIKFAAADVASMKLGTANVTKVMLGVVEIWPGTLPAVFPVLATSNTEVGTILAQTNAIAAPSGVVAGNLLVAFCTLDGGGGATGITASTGWTQIATSWSDPTHRITVFARVADGGANDALAFSGPASTPGNQDYCASIHRITDHTVTTLPTDIKSAASQAVSANADPPSLDTGSVKKWLWLTAAGVDQTSPAADSISAMPAGYTVVVNLESSGTTSSSLMAVAQRNLEVQTENPGTFTSSNRQWVALTVAIPG